MLVPTDVPVGNEGRGAYPLLSLLSAAVVAGAGSTLPLDVGVRFAIVILVVVLLIGSVGRRKAGCGVRGAQE